MTRTNTRDDNLSRNHWTMLYIRLWSNKWTNIHFYTMIFAIWELFFPENVQNVRWISSISNNILQIICFTFTLLWQLPFSQFVTLDFQKYKSYYPIFRTETLTSQSYPFTPWNLFPVDFRDIDVALIGNSFHDLFLLKNLNLGNKRPNGPSREVKGSG